MSGINVVEYLGQNAEGSVPIEPVTSGNCPFSDRQCKKLVSSDKKKPVCSVRSTKGVLWIVCPERLCSSHGSKLTEHQRDILLQVAKLVFRKDVQESELAYKKEVNFKLESHKKARADFILEHITESAPGDPRTKVIVEIQGGGETSNTGTMTRHVDGWEGNPNRTNTILRQKLDKVAPIVNNAWKRQLDQLIIKGAIAKRTGFRMVLCVGELLGNYLNTRVKTKHNLKDGGWNLAILPFKESNSAGQPIKFEVDAKGAIYTAIDDFLNDLVAQGGIQTDPFFGTFMKFDGSEIVRNTFN